MTTTTNLSERQLRRIEREKQAARAAKAAAKPSAKKKATTASDTSTKLYALIAAKEKEAAAAEKSGAGPYNRYAGMKCYVCKRRPAAAHNVGACNSPRCVLQSMRDHV